MNKMLKKIVITSILFFSFSSHAEDRYQKDIPQSIITQFERAREERRNGDIEKSIISLKSILDITPEYYLANYNLALALTEAKKYSESEKYYLKAIDISISNHITDYSIYNSFGWMYLVSGEFVKAEKYFDDALRYVEMMPTEDAKRKTYNNAGLIIFILGNTNRLSPP